MQHDKINKYIYLNYNLKKRLVYFCISRGYQNVNVVCSLGLLAIKD